MHPSRVADATAGCYSLAGRAPLALRATPGLELLGLLAAPALEFQVEPHLCSLVPPSRVDELDGERAVESLGEVSRLLGRPDAIHLLASSRDRLALEPFCLGQPALRFRTLELDRLHEVGAPVAQLDFEPLEPFGPAPRELRRKSAGRRVDDLGGRLFDDRVRQRLGIDVV